MTTGMAIFGFGYTAAAFARALDRNSWRVVGTTRRPNAADALRAQDVVPALWRDTGPPDTMFDDLGAALVSTAPSENGCPTLNAARERLAAARPRWIGYLSSNGVYGDHGGDWVDEDSPLRAASPRARARVAAETAWRAFGETHDVPVAIFRLPGIYGPGRSAIDTVRRGDARRIVKKGQVFSRAHVADISAVLRASLNAPDAGAVFNVADDEPAPPQDVITFACQLLNVAPPPEIPFETADLSPMARSFYADNKRVSNAQMKSVLGVAPAFPTYREGLRAILAAEQ